MKLLHKVKLNGKVYIQKKVKIILQKDAKLIIGKNVYIKNNTIILVKKGATLIIGNNSSLGHHNEISVGNKISIGEDNIFGPYVYVTDSNHEYSDPEIMIRKQGMKMGQVVIGSNNWISRGVNVLMNSEISDGCVLAAGSMITKKFQNDNMIIGGIPAKEIKGRIEKK